MPKLLTRNKILAYMCAKCFTTKADTLAWFQSDSSMWADSLLCRICFQQAFNNQTKQEKMKWGFYADRQKKRNS